jgi:hypothetical protein
MLVVLKLRGLQSAFVEHYCPSYCDNAHACSANLYLGTWKRKRLSVKKTSHWQLSELQDFFHEAISSPNLPTIDVFIDALDE